jgi:hypothetical protein
MSKPERPENLARMLADQRKRLERVERRDAFGDKRRVAAAAGGLYAEPALVFLAPDAAGWMDISTATGWTDVALFAPAVSGQLTVHGVSNGAGADLSTRLYYPALSRVLGTGVFVEDHALIVSPNPPQSPSPVYLVAGAWDTDLAAATTVYAATAVLQVMTADAVTTNRFKILSSRWGQTNV